MCHAHCEITKRARLLVIRGQESTHFHSQLRHACARDPRRLSALRCALQGISRQMHPTPCAQCTRTQAQRDSLHARHIVLDAHARCQTPATGRTEPRARARALGAGRDGAGRLSWHLRLRAARLIRMRARIPLRQLPDQGMCSACTARTHTHASPGHSSAARAPHAPTRGI